MKRITILVVEDNAISLRLLRLTLEAYTVLEARDARAALALASQRLPDLVITDLGLPDLDGLELLHRLRALPGAAGLPVIAVSGFVDRLEQARTSAAGFTDMLPKPVDTDLLVRTVELHLPRQAERSPGRGRRVVVADDDPVLLRLLARLLAGQDFQVVQASNGAEVLELVRADAPDAFVLDALMPSPDGFRTCSLLRQDPRFAAAPIVLVTSAFVSEDDRLLAERAGAHAFVLRTPGSEAVIDALVAAFAAPDRRPDAKATGPIDGEGYHRRVLQQLERQATMSVSLAQRASHQAVELSVLGAIAESLVVRRDTGPDLQVVLEQCLDTGGISAGAIFVIEGEGVVGRSRVGLGEEAAVELALSLSAPGCLEAVFARDGPTILEPGAMAPGLSAYGSAILLPLTSQRAGLGVLALLSHARGTTAPDRLAFLRNVAGQIGQALALARSFALLSESEERFRQLAENIDDVFWIRDVVSDRVLYVNPAYERLFGRPRADLYRDGNSWLEGVHPDDLPEVRRVHEAGVAGGDYAPTYRIVRPDGSLRWVRVQGGHIRDEVGRIVRLVGVATDVTELKEAADFQERAARVATFNVEVGAALTRADDLKGALTACTEAAVQHLDAAAACIWLLDPREQVLVLQASSGPAAPLDAHARVAVGALAIEEVAATSGLTTFASYPLQVSGQAVGLFAIFARHPIADDTRRKLAFVADVIAVAVRRNEDAAAKATLEAQLRQAQKMEAVGRLAGGVAHDFNNLLTVILGYADVVTSKLRPDDPMRRHVEQIHKAGMRATSLTRQLLVFSRHQALDRKVLDANTIVRDLEKMLGRLIGEDLEISIVPGKGLGRVLADAGQIEQVILNLCVNARDAMPRGGRLTIETGNAELDGRANGFRGPVKPGRYVMLAVSDTGTGIPPEVLEHMFEPFFTTKEASKGTGLGLSTVYGIVQTAGGVISVYTEVGRGTTFKVYLPRVDAALDAPEASHAGAQRRGSETVLLVEDDELVRDLAQGILEANGYRVVVAENGGAALLACEKHTGRLDLVLTDVVMPHMSGRELVERLLKVRPGLKVLYFSGYTSGVVLHDDVVGSGAAFLQKPFSADALARKIREVLDGPAPPPPSSRPAE